MDIQEALEKVLQKPLTNESKQLTLDDDFGLLELQESNVSLAEKAILRLADIIVNGQDTVALKAITELLKISGMYEKVERHDAIRLIIEEPEE